MKLLSHGPEPVSYTHLDVYKRQDQNGGLHYVWIAILVAAIATIVSFAATKVILSRDMKKAAK